MDIAQIITIILAIYGAGLSTALGIREWRRSRPQLRVTSKHGYVIGDNQEYSEPVWVMEAVNGGPEALFLSSLGFRKREGKLSIRSPYPRNIVPAKVEKGRNLISVYACRWLRELADRHEIVGVYFQDETGKEWTAKLSKDELAFCLQSVGDGWLLETRQPLKPAVWTTRKPVGKRPEPA